VTEAVVVDTTVQEKAIAHPTEHGLLLTAIEPLGAHAKKNRMRLRQSYVRVARHAAMKTGRYLHSRQKKRARRQLNSCPCGVCFLTCGASWQRFLLYRSGKRNGWRSRRERLGTFRSSGGRSGLSLFPTRDGSGMHQRQSARRSGWQSTKDTRDIASHYRTRRFTSNS
jgi:hypothetical protein